MDLLNSHRQPQLLGGDERQELSARALRACLAAEAALASLRAECVPLQSPHLWQGGGGVGESAAAPSNWQNLELGQRSLQLQIDACENFALCATAAFKQLCNVHFSRLGAGINDAQLSGHNSSPSVQKASPMPIAGSAWKQKPCGHRPTSCSSKRFSFSSPAGWPPNCAPSSHSSARSLQIQEEAPNIIVNSRNSLTSLMSTNGSDSDEAASKSGSNGGDGNEDKEEDFKSPPPSPVLTFDPPCPTVLSATSSSISGSSTRTVEKRTEFPPPGHFSEIDILRKTHQSDANSTDPVPTAAECGNDSPQLNSYVRSTTNTGNMPKADIPSSFCKSREDNSLHIEFGQASPTPSSRKLRHAESKRSAQSSESPRPSHESLGPMRIQGLEASVECDRCTRTAESPCLSLSPSYPAIGRTSVTSKKNSKDEICNPGNALQVESNCSGVQREKSLCCAVENSSKRAFTSSSPSLIKDDYFHSPRSHDFFVQTSNLEASKEPLPNLCEVGTICYSREISSPSPTAREDLQLTIPCTGESSTKYSTRPTCFQNGAPQVRAHQPERVNSQDGDELLHQRSSPSQAKPSNLDIGSLLQQTESSSSDKSTRQHVGNRRTSSPMQQPGIEWLQPDQSRGGTGVAFSSSLGAFSGTQSSSLSMPFPHAGAPNAMTRGKSGGAAVEALPLYEKRHPRPLVHHHQQQRSRGSCCGGDLERYPEPAIAHQRWPSCDSDASGSRGRHSSGTSSSTSSSAGTVPHAVHKSSFPSLTTLMPRNKDLGAVSLLKSSKFPVQQFRCFSGEQELP